METQLDHGHDRQDAWSTSRSRRSRIRPLLLVALSLPAGPFVWVALEFLAGGMRRSDMDLSALSPIPRLMIAHPWVALIPTLIAMTCGVLMLRARGMMVHLLTLVAMGALLALVGAMGWILFEVLAPLYEYQPL